MFSAVNPVVFTLDIEGFPHNLQVLEFRARERVALAADLAQRWASQGGHP
ncbi:hypothetical protein [Pseudomonas lini]|uniref:Uncharacterized protein n=1 Tax=Pseudomonas lini TaxID=163011 RepID=A0A1H2ADK5_9PSED|nr:hypothetical protein [Pseudomonas lini]NSX07511.1 hypothetical protein [Pseudomonas lini]SDT44065.1 hypothetical protein SAMN04490191_4463 [Pseudomonas lini]